MMDNSDGWYDLSGDTDTNGPILLILSLFVLQCNFFIQVDLANQISRRIREKQGEISDDETIRFKSYLVIIFDYCFHFCLGVNYWLFFILILIKIVL